MSHRTDLEESIRESYDLIREYEDIVRLSDWPNERLRAKREIEKQRGLIERYRSQYLLLAADRIPEDIQEILSRSQPYEKIIGRPRHGREVPRLLPYLVNREEQESKLDEALKQLRRHPSRLLVCLVHGDEFQCHDTLLECLKEDCLPRLLELDPRRTAIKDCLLEWPRVRNVSELHEGFRKNLADKVLGRKRASTQEIDRALAAYPGPVMIHAHLLTEDWKRYGSEVLMSFLLFLQNWPEPSPRQRLFVFLFIKYSVKQNLGLFKRRRFESVNDKIARLLETAPFSEYDRLLCTVLPRLHSIARSEVEDWARREEIRRFCQCEELIAGIREIYNRWEIKTSATAIPMENLARQLRAILCGELVLREEVA
jgi:hypothetical protein